MSFKPIKYRAHNGYDTDEASDSAALQPHEYGESMTVQSQAEEADINVMLRRFGVIKELPISSRVPSYGDFTEVGDFRSALNAVMEMQDNFMRLPVKLRAELNNDPQQFLEFCADPANMGRLRELGLANPEVKADVKGFSGNAGSSDSSAGAGAGGKSSAAAGSSGAGSGAG